MEERVIAILNDIVGAEEGELEADMNLFETGLLDSFGVIQLFVELEKEFGAVIAVETLTRDEIATASLIAILIEDAL